jgi:hypothetical protein
MTVSVLRMEDGRYFEKRMNMPVNMIAGSFQVTWLFERGIARSQVWEMLPGIGFYP